LVEGDPFLGLGVALTNRDGLIIQRVKVDCDAERSADLVLTAVAPSDGLGIIEFNIPVLTQLIG
jgi:hypothetical protein